MQVSHWTIPVGIVPSVLSVLTDVPDSWGLPPLLIVSADHSQYEMPNV